MKLLIFCADILPSFLPSISFLQRSLKCIYKTLVTNMWNGSVILYSLEINFIIQNDIKAMKLLISLEIKLLLITQNQRISGCYRYIFERPISVDKQYLIPNQN